MRGSASLRPTGAVFDRAGRARFVTTAEDQPASRRDRRNEQKHQRDRGYRFDG
jgi:hypothetical protein